MSVIASHPNLANLVVSVGDARFCGDAGSILATYALGSCIGVALFDPAVNLAGLLHFQLPSAAADSVKAREHPLMFADTGMEHLLRSMEAHGAVRKRMKVKIAGGAEMMDDAKVFNIGRRNHTAIRKFLWQQGMLIEAEDIGGKSPRTMYLHAADGTVLVKSPSGTRTL